VIVEYGCYHVHWQIAQISELIARMIGDQKGNIYTTERKITTHKGLVYLDCYQNGNGKTIAGPFSARPVPGATVSVPLKWSEVNGKLDAKKFTIRTIPGRMRKLRDDPLAGVLTGEPDLHGARARL